MRLKHGDKIVFDLQIHSRLLRVTLRAVPLHAFINNPELSTSDIETEFRSILDVFEDCLQKDEDITAARISEFHLLPRVQRWLRDDYVKTNIAKADKSDVIDLIKDTAARLDSSLISNPKSTHDKASGGQTIAPDQAVTKRRM